jgi:hypothetical protein
MGLFGRESQADVERIERISRWLRERHPFGLFSVLFGAIAVVDSFTLIIGATCGIIAIIVGSMGLRQIAQGDPRLGRRFCIAGIALGCVGVTLTIIMATVVYPWLAANN